MRLRSVNPSGSNIPGISQAIVVESGRLLFLSGHVPMTRDGSIAGSELEVQLNQVFENIQTTLQEAGAGSKTLRGSPSTCATTAPSHCQLFAQRATVLSTRSSRLRVLSWV